MTTAKETCVAFPKQQDNTSIKGKIPCKERQGGMWAQARYFQTQYKNTQCSKIDDQKQDKSILTSQKYTKYFLKTKFFLY